MRPAYLILGLLLPASSLMAAGPEQPPGIEYASPAEAWEALSGKPDVSISYLREWRVVTERESTTIWTFTTPGNPAHPSVVKRMLVEKDGSFHVASFIQCGADKAECDKLVADFRALDARMKEDIRRRKALR